MSQSLPRRNAIKVALGGVAAIALGAPVDRARAAVEVDPSKPKMTRQQAQYQDEPVGDIYMCLTCTLYLPPLDCKVVEGPVSATGWCKAFDFAD